MSELPKQITGLNEIAGDYRALFCDVWGVLHNGVRAFPGTIDALSNYRRETGGTVVLVTNAPRPATAIADQLAAFGVPDDAYDSIVTSGDVTRAAVAARPGARVYHLGPERDLGYYDGLEVTLVGAADAELISCTGLFDDTTETPEDYREQLSDFAGRGLPMVCANPDIVVERGDELVFCAGALARLYEELGGGVTLSGKPHPPIYEAAMANAGLSDRSQALAVGDGLPTDVRGACNAGIDVLFITGGIHSEDFGPVLEPDPEKVRARLAAEGLTARAFMPVLAWQGGAAR
jgi:HAD superfamily hydrolase (TIGR01459 family)